MYVELPTTGCNILRSDSSFYNYSPDSRTRSTYYIFDGQAKLESATYNQYGYTYTGDCLSTGDLIYRPEYKEVLLPFFSIVSFLFICAMIYHIIIKRLMP